MKARDLAVYLVLGLLLSSMFISVAAVSASAQAGDTTTSEPTTTTTESSNESEYTVDQIVQWANEDRDISPSEAREIKDWFVENQGKFSATEIRQVSSWIASQVPEQDNSEEANDSNSGQTELPEGVEGVSDREPNEVYYGIPGSDTVITDVEFQPDEDRVLVTIHSGVGREVVTARDMSQTNIPSSGGAFTPTQSRFVLDDDMGGQTFTISVPAESTRKGQQFVGLKFRSGDRPVMIASEPAEFWSSTPSHWMVGFAFAQGAVMVAIAVVWRTDPYDDIYREL